MILGTSNHKDDWECGERALRPFFFFFIHLADVDFHLLVLHTIPLG